MTTMAADVLPVSDDQENESSKEDMRAKSSGGNREIHWEVVAETAGIAPAQIIADRLKAEKIPARAWQEGAGQAIGLTVGLLGTGYVVVPEEYAERAREILDETFDEEVDGDELDSGSDMEWNDY